MQNGARTIEYIRQQVTFCFLPGPYTPRVHRPVTFCVRCLINHFSRPSLLALLSSRPRLSPAAPSPPAAPFLPPRPPLLAALLLSSPCHPAALLSLPPCRCLLHPSALLCQSLYHP